MESISLKFALSALSESCQFEKELPPRRTGGDLQSLKTLKIVNNCGKIVINYVEANDPGDADDGAEDSLTVADHLRRVLSRHRRFEDDAD